MSEENLIDEVASSLERVQTFDSSSLTREDLGSELKFTNAIEPAKRLIELFKQIPLSILSVFPDQELQKILKQSDATYNRFDEILEFSIGGQSEGNLLQKRDSIIQNLVNSYDQNFTVLSPIISYASSQAIDFNRLEQQGRATIQAVEDKARKLNESLEDQSQKANTIVDQIRKTAAEQGVSQQSSYFKNEAEKNASDAYKWQLITIGIAVLLAALAISSVFLYERGFLVADNLHSSLHLIFSKILIFGTITYLLVISARNFLSYKHNETINRHRLNALLTFQALVEASRSEETQDIVLSHAASCIFSPQPTGYIKAAGSTGGTPTATFTDVLPRVIGSRMSAGTEVT